MPTTPHSSRGLSDSGRKLEYLGGSGGLGSCGKKEEMGFLEEESLKEREREWEWEFCCCCCCWCGELGFWRGFRERGRVLGYGWWEG